MPRRNALPAVLRAAVLAAVSMFCASSFAQAWPAAKPLRVVVNFPPSGVADVIARAVAVPLGEALAQQVLVENRTGANGISGADAVAKSD